MLRIDSLKTLVRQFLIVRDHLPLFWTQCVLSLCAPMCVVFVHQQHLRLPQTDEVQLAAVLLTILLFLLNVLLDQSHLLGAQLFFPPHAFPVQWCHPLLHPVERELDVNIGRLGQLLLPILPFLLTSPRTERFDSVLRS